jgi:hypothetical protein
MSSFSKIHKPVSEGIHIAASAYHSGHTGPLASSGIRTFSEERRTIGTSAAV